MVKRLLMVPVAALLSALTLAAIVGAATAMEVALYEWAEGDED